MSVRPLHVSRHRLFVCALLLSAASSATAHAEDLPSTPSSRSLGVVPPKLISDATVAYPEGARGDHTVVLVIVVDADGAVRTATPAEAVEPFSSLAAEAAMKFRFEPARRGGEPIAARVRLEVVFKEPLPEPPAMTAQLVPGATAQPRPAPPPELTPAEIVVEGERPEPGRTVTLTRAEVREIPGTFGDPFRAVEVMPGVTPIVSGLPFFFIRGAPPGNAGYFLDGLRVPLLFHVGVGPSVVHPAVIERVDLYPGGYPARFGRFGGGIVAAETTAPQGEIGGEYNLRLFDAGAMLEAPFGGGSGSVLLAGRYSYTALLLSLFSPETTLDYWDYQARVTYEPTPADRFTLFSFGSYDYVGEKAETETLTLFGTEFHRVELRHDRALGHQGTFRTALAAGLERSRVQEDRYVRDRTASARTDLEYRLSPRVRVRAGTDLALDAYDIELGRGELSPAAREAAERFPTRTDLAVGAHADVVLTVHRGLEVTPGVRADGFVSDGAAAWALDPRLALRAGVSRRFSLVVALGMAHQPPAFVVPVPGFQPGGLIGGLQRSIQESMGLEVDLGDATMASATVFQNAFFDMSDPLGATSPELSGCPPGAYPADSIGGDFGEQLTGNPPYCGPRFVPGTLGPDRSGGGGQGADSRGGRRVAEALEVRTTGASYGLELLVRRRLTGKLGGFFAYTLSRSTRSYGRRRFIAAFDRTHVLNFALAYDLGRHWRAGARTMFYTGLPKAPDPAAPNESRLPPFFRLDLRVEKRWNVSDEVWLSVVAEWMNVTLSKEAVTTRCTLSGCSARKIGPVTIPSLGLEGGF